MYWHICHCGEGQPLDWVWRAEITKSSRDILCFGFKDRRHSEMKKRIIRMHNVLQKKKNWHFKRCPFYVFVCIIIYILSVLCPSFKWYLTANAKDSDIRKKFMDFGSFIWKTEIWPIKISPNGNVFIGEKWKNISNKKVSVVNLLKSLQ